MDDTELRSIVIATLKEIAPEIEEAELRPEHPLRRQVDLDSMDWLNFLVGLAGRLAVEIPEADYRKLGTVNELVAYLRDAGRRAG
ncbi:MAG: acyl carrier protein [Thauera sp.]|nr:acyl carrier protein [Thauera sp.]